MKKRDLHYVNPEIRKTITHRILVYWFACAMFSTLPIIIGTTLVENDVQLVDQLAAFATRYWPLYLVLFGMLPFVIKDSMRVANRTFGPLDRLQRELIRYRETGEYSPVVFRDGDFLADLISEINHALKTQALEKEPELVEST